MFKLRHIIQEIPRELAQAKQFRRRGNYETAEQIQRRVAGKIAVIAALFSAAAGLCFALIKDLVT